MTDLHQHATPSDQRSGQQTVAALTSVTKRYAAGKTALDGFSLDLAQGEVHALLGPNGAGKTTAISILLGLRKPNQGTVTLFGRSPDDPSARARIGATPQDTGFPETLKVAELIDFVRGHYRDAESRQGLLERFGLAEIADRQTGGLSGGQKRRLAVALAFAGKPDAVFLDEPTTGLDVEARRALWQAVEGYVAHGGTVLLTTHYIEEAEALADRVTVIDRGRAVMTGRVDEIKQRVGVRRVRFRAQAVPDLSASPADILRATVEDGWVTLYATDSDAAIRALVHSGAEFSGLEVAPVSLEEAFLSVLRSPEGGNTAAGDRTSDAVEASPCA